MTKAQRQQALLDGSSPARPASWSAPTPCSRSSVEFADLGLVVVDEQHRFGVEQRAALTDKAGAPPHVLVMTATPIPRTVAMTVFGDLEISTLTELPAGRAPIQTNVVPLAGAARLDRRGSGQRVREEVEAGHQAYVVCPRIAGDDAEHGREPDRSTTTTRATRSIRPARRWPRSSRCTTELALGDRSPACGSAMLHGRLPADEKDRTMRAFAAGEVDVLVSTTVIEVGVDVANATTMVVLDADRFGVSQLHQLRGRVGRGGHPGLCLLVSRAEAGSAGARPARRRRRHHRRLRAVPGRPRAAPRGRRARRLAVAASAPASQDLRVLRDEKTIVAGPRGGRGGCSTPTPSSRTAPDLAAAVAALEVDRSAVRASWRRLSR